LLLFSPLKPKLLKFKVPMTVLKPSLVLSLPEETPTIKLNPEDADATLAHVVKPRKNTVDITPLMLLEKLSRKPPRTSKEKLRRERTKRKPKLESRRLKRKPRDPKPSKNPLMRPRRSSMPSRKPSTNKLKSTPRKSKIKLSRKLETQPKKKLQKLVTILIKQSKLKPSETLLIKPLVKSRRELTNQRKMPPPLKLPLKRPPVTPKPLEIRLPRPLKPPETRPMPLLKVPKRKPTKLERKPRKPRIKLLLKLDPHQRNE